MLNFSYLSRFKSLGQPSEHYPIKRPWHLQKKAFIIYWNYPN